jgi:hypothetical protein
MSNRKKNQSTFFKSTIGKQDRLMRRAKSPVTIFGVLQDLFLYSVLKEFNFVLEKPKRHFLIIAKFTICDHL